MNKYNPNRVQYIYVPKDISLHLFRILVYKLQKYFTYKLQINYDGVTNYLYISVDIRNDAGIAGYGIRLDIEHFDSIGQTDTFSATDMYRVVNNERAQELEKISHKLVNTSRLKYFNDDDLMRMMPKEGNPMAVNNNIYIYECSFSFIEGTINNKGIDRN